MPKKIERPFLDVVVRRFQVTVDLADVALAEDGYDEVLRGGADSDSWVFFPLFDTSLCLLTLLFDTLLLFDTPFESFAPVDTRQIF